jgi:hypothetical protein
MRYTLLFLSFLSFILISAARVTVSYAPIDEKPSVLIDNRMLGIWKMNEDTNYHNYFVVEKRNDFEYALTYMNRGGDNKTYERFTLYPSVVNGITFLNVLYEIDWEERKKPNGFVLLKVVNFDGPSFTAAVCSDPSLKNLTRSQDVRERVSKNINNAVYYKDTIHLDKRLSFLTSGN